MKRKRVVAVDSRVRLSEKQGEIYGCGKPYRMGVGGIRSGKTWAALLYGLYEYCLSYAGCDVLVLRRTFRQLDSGVVRDFRTLVNPKAYEWRQAPYPVGTFANGSRMVFASCPHDLESEIQQYLGQGYPFILVDELAQFSPDLWDMLVSRNTVNPSCKPARDGRMPEPVIWGATNPIGPWWPYYRQLFRAYSLDGTRDANWRPPALPDGGYQDEAGVWWVRENGERRCFYDPANYFWVHTTVFDNAPLIERDPRIIERLNSQPEAKRKKMLLGVLGDIEGQYFECWIPEHHVVDLREHPESVRWLSWQPVWAGWDWGMAHANVIHLFTKAMVMRPGLDRDYVLRTVCFAELAIERNDMSLAQMASRVAATCFLPDGQPARPSTIYFSHEKFNRQIEQHSPADQISEELRKHRLPSVTPATRDRVARAAFLFHMLQSRQLVVLSTCRRIIDAIPLLERDPKNLDDVKKVESIGDDAYDAFSYGLFGQLGARAAPEEVVREERIRRIPDPFVRKLEAFKVGMKAITGERQVPFWQRRLKEPRPR